MERRKKNTVETRNGKSQVLNFSTILFTAKQLFTNAFLQNSLISSPSLVLSFIKEIESIKCNNHINLVVPVTVQNY